MAAVFGAPGAAAEPAVESPDHANADPFGRKYPPRIYRTARLDTEPPDIDGRLDDKAWQHGEWSADFRQQLPVEGAAPSQATEIKIFYDDRHLYVAVRAYDDPALVHRYPGRRDDFGGYAVDIVGICFDSYNDKRFGFEFDLTAGGGKIDLVLGNGETEWDTTWDAVWDGGWRTTIADGPRSSGSRSVSFVSVRRTSRSGACTSGAGSRAITKRISGSSSPARTPAACTSSASFAVFTGCRAVAIWSCCPTRSAGPLRDRSCPAAEPTVRVRSVSMPSWASAPRSRSTPR